MYLVLFFMLLPFISNTADHESFAISQVRGNKLLFKTAELTSTYDVKQTPPDRFHAMRHTIDLTSKEATTGKTFKELLKPDLPWMLVIYSDKKGSVIEYLDLVGLVKTYYLYSSETFKSSRSSDIILKAMRKFIDDKHPGAERGNLNTFLFYPTDDETYHCTRYIKVAGELRSEHPDRCYKASASDMQSIFAIALCKDYVPALKLKMLLKEKWTRDGTNESIRIQKKYWNDRLAKLSPEKAEETKRSLKEQFRSIKLEC